MIADLPPYPEYRDSGVPALGDVPQHWEVRRLKEVFRQIVGGSTPATTEASFWDGDVVWITPADVSRTERLHTSLRRITRRGLESCSSQIVPRGSIIVTSRAPVGNVALAEVDLCTNQGCKSLVATEQVVNPAFGLVVLKTLKGELQSEASGTTFAEISTNRIGTIPMPLPPLPEQAAIVRFLDHADRRIGRYIAAKRNLIALLNEQKQAIIHRAVTRGLDPHVRLKPSGVEWLGDVPEHWEVAALRRRWTVSDCKHLTVPFVQDGIPLASVREVQSFDLDLSTSKRTMMDWYESLIEGGRAPRRGDVIYCRNVSVGAAAFVNTDARFAMGQDVCLIRSTDQNQRYLNYFLHSPAMDRQLAMLLVGSTFKRINVSDIKGLVIAMPPRAEQDAIATYLDRAFQHLERPISDANLQIGLMREYRTRLMADVVTGNLDVRAAAARLPHEGDEPEPLDDLEVGPDGDESGDEADLDAIAEEAEA